MPPGSVTKHSAPRLPRPALPLMLLAAAILALTATGISHTFIHQHGKEVARLQAIADLKARQITDWLKERQGDAEFVQTSPFFAGNYRRWRETGDPASRDLLQTRLEQLRQSRGFTAILLLDNQGKPVLGSARAPLEIAPPLRDAARQATADLQVHRAGPYRGMAGTPRLDFVAPLTAAGVHPPLVVLHTNPSDWLYRTLQTWPVPSDSGETLLFRRDGGQILFLNELRHRKDTALKLRLPLASPKLLSAQVLRGTARPGSLVEGEDYRGVAAFGVAQAIPGTDWFLLAKMDRAELYSEVAHDAVWICLAGLLTMFMAAAGFYLLRQREQLSLATSVQQSQAEHLRALHLLAAIADSSDDAIFAQDMEGHFILFSRAAERITGKSAQEVIGHDETALFPSDTARKQIADNRRVIESGTSMVVEETLDTVDGKRTYFTTKSPLRGKNGKVSGLFGIARDITERKRMEDALRRERDLNQRYLDTVQTVIVALDSDGRVSMINRKGCELLGYAEEELIGCNWFETCLPQPEGMDAVYPVFRQIMAGDLAEAEYFENPILCRDGHQRLIAWHNAYLADESGRVAGTLSSGEDITGRKQAEAALQASELSYRSLFENMMNGYAHCRMLFENGEPRDFVYLDVNKAFEEHTGLRDVVGRKASEVIPGIRESDASLFEIYGRVALSGCPEHFETYVEAMKMWFSISVYSQQREHFVAVFDVITERKQVELALRESEKRFHDIVNASADWIWEVDAEGHFTYASDSVQDMLGYTSAEIIGKTPFDLMPPGEAEKLRAQFAAIAAQCAPFRDLDNVNRCKDGSLRHVQSNGMPILDAGGKLLGYRGLDRDVTGKKQAELVLRESEERFRALFNNAAVAIMIHDRDSGAIIEANRRAIESYGYETLEELQKNTFWLEPPYSYEDAARLIRKAATDGPQRFEWKNRDHHGRVFWEDVLLNRTTLNGIERVLSITTDITARKAAEDTLYQQAEELRQRNEELERFNRATVGREMDMIALKQQINTLSLRLGQEPPFALSFLDAPSAQEKEDKAP